MKKIKKQKPIPVGRVERMIERPTEDWKGACHQISALLLDRGVCEGKLRYGHYLGYIAPTSIFAKVDVGFCRHGWIEQKDGTIVDPTRWVFEDAKPYIYIGANNNEYEFGGNEMRKVDGAPEPSGKMSTVKVSKALLKQLQEIFGCEFQVSDNGTIEMAVNQLFWLANANPKILGKVVKEMYEEFDRLDMGAFVPCDNFNAVMKGEVFV